MLFFQYDHYRGCSQRKQYVRQFKSHTGYPDIPIKIIKDNSTLFEEQICACFNELIGKGKFPNCLRLANITPVFKKAARTAKINYRPVAIPPVFSKIFETLLPKQHLVLTVCSCHVTYAFQSESTLYSCLNVKELLVRSRREI